jgi:AcrR family transcriptional regulator
MRLSRSESKQQTRERLLETARETFLARGYHATTLDHIADAAGLTKGAVYSNFGSKDDLFLAVYAAQVDARVQEIEAAGRRGGLAEGARANARRITARHQRQPEWHALLLEFTTYAIRNPEIRRRVAKEHRRIVAAVARSLEEASERTGVTLALPARILALMLTAIGSGIRIERDLDPDDTPTDLMETAMELLTRAAARKRARLVKGAAR